MTVPPDRPHRRYDPLAGQWVLVSPHRTERPWQGQVDDAPGERRPAYDPGCYLCPGNRRASGDVNPDYESTFVFTNDFAALHPDDGRGADHPRPVLRAEGVAGTSRVICFSPRHDLTLARMGRDGIGRVIDLWADQAAELGERYRWVQIFENKGEMMGASNPHPHGQIWASTSLPTRSAAEDDHQRSYREVHGSRLLLDYAEHETGAGERVVAEDDGWLAVVPYWAQWPFETLVLPRFEVARLEDLGAGGRAGLAGVLERLLARYDNLFRTSFPYSMGWHGAPGGAGGDHWQLHAHFNPPLLRSATIRKFMVGYEMFGEAQRDLTPETAATRLRELPGERFEPPAADGQP